MGAMESDTREGGLIIATHQICPTCFLEQPEDREPLEYFAGIGVGTVTADDIGSASWETQRFLSFLSTAAAVGALAGAHACHLAEGEHPDWLSNWSFLVEELGGEAQRRLDRLKNASELWRERTKELEKKKDK